VTRTKNGGTRNSPSRVPDDEEVVAALRALERTIFKYPMAIQAAFSALAAEGRRYAKTEEGAEWRSKLAGAYSMGRARMVWEVLSLSAFTEEHTAALPSVFVENLVRTLRTQRLEPLLSRIFEKAF
jgi:hypothetical protein